MVVGIGIIELRLHDCHSLKGKRKVIKAVIARLKNSFNVSAAEVSSNDKYQKGEIGVALVGNDRGVINSKIDKLFNFVEELGLAELVNTDLEIINI